MHNCQRVKGGSSEQGRFAYRLGTATPVRLGLSGTPLPHEPVTDSYGVYRSLDATIFGTNKARHLQRYAVMGGYESRQVVGYQNQLEFREKLNSIRFHVDVDESTLPPEVHTDIVVELPDKVRKLYKQLSNDFYAQVESGEIVAANAAVAITRLSQICQGFAPTEDLGGKRSVQELHSAKQNALIDFLLDLPDNEPVVVFCRFRRDLESIHAACTKVGRQSSELSGRKHELEAWQRGDTTVLATQLRAGSVGVDMTRSHYGVYYSYSFPLEEYEQSVRRLRRPGQQHAVLFYHLIVANSVDIKIRRGLEKRQDVIKAVMEVP